MSGGRRLRVGVVLGNREITTARRHWPVRVRQLRHRVGRGSGARCRGRASTLIVRVLRVASGRRGSTAGSSVVSRNRLRTRWVRVVVATRRPRTSAVRRRDRPSWILLIGSVGAARRPLDTRLVVPRPLNGVLRYLDDLAALALITIGSLRQSSMDWRERVEHGLVELALIGMHGSSVLTQVVQTGKGFAAVTREGSFASVFPHMPGQVLAACEHLVAITVTPASEHLSPADANRDDGDAVRSKVASGSGRSTVACRRWRRDVFLSGLRESVVVGRLRWVVAADGSYRWSWLRRVAVRRTRWLGHLV